MSYQQHVIMLAACFSRVTAHTSACSLSKDIWLETVWHSDTLQIFIQHGSYGTFPLKMQISPTHIETYTHIYPVVQYIPLKKNHPWLYFWKPQRRFNTPQHSIRQTCTGCPRLITVSELAVSVISHDGHKMDRYTTAPSFTIFFVAFVKQRWLL